MRAWETRLYNCRIDQTLRRRWTLPVLLFLATTLNYLDRQTLAILAPFVQRDLGVDNEKLGVLFAIFYYAYTFAQFSVGPILDRVGLRWFYGAAVLGWSAVCALTATAGGFVALAGFRLMLGIVESVNWPASLRMIASTMPPAERPLANGLFTSGTSIGALIAPALILGVANWYGWRWGFVAVGALGAVWFVLWLMLAPAIPREATVQAPARAYGVVLRTRAFWLAFAVSVVVNPALYFNLNWLPTYFVQQRGFAPAQLSGALTAIYLGLDAGYLGCGVLVLALTRMGTNVLAARRAVFLLATAMVCVSALVPRSDSPVALLAVVNCGIGMWISTYLTMAQEVSRENVSTAAGLLGGSGSLSGAVAMWGVGRVTQQTGNFALPLLAVTIMALMAACFAWIGTRDAALRRDR